LKEKKHTLSVVVIKNNYAIINFALVNDAHWSTWNEAKFGCRYSINLLLTSN